MAVPSQNEAVRNANTYTGVRNETGIYSSAQPSRSQTVDHGNPAMPTVVAGQHPKRLVSRTPYQYTVPNRAERSMSLPNTSEPQVPAAKPAGRKRGAEKDESITLPNKTLKSPPLDQAALSLMTLPIR